MQVLARQQTFCEIPAFKEMSKLIILPSWFLQKITLMVLVFVPFFRQIFSLEILPIKAFIMPCLYL